MSANIDMYVGRSAAWHGLGTVTGNYMTWAEIEAKGLDFQIFKSQLRDGLGRPVDAWGTFRWNQADKLAGRKDATVFLAPVGEDYQIIPHGRGFQMVDLLIKSQDGAHYETAGSLGKGKVVWGLADLNLSTRVGDDETKHYLLFHTSHDGSTSFEFRDCATRVVCQNTLNIALGERTKNQFRIRHTKNAPDRVIQAQDALAGYRTDLETFSQQMQFLAGRKVTRESAEKIFARLFPVRKREDETPVNSTRRDNILAEVLSLYESNDGNAFPAQRGSAYNLLNAITAYTDHARGGTANRQESAIFGSGDALKRSAMTAVLEVAEDLPAMPTRLDFPVTEPTSAEVDATIEDMERFFGEGD
jgi:phage/plasmid-like protein (TIGR03299 family)